MAEKRTRVLLIIAPTLYECRRTADVFRIDPSRFGEVRYATTAYSLRGWSRGTPFIAMNRETWFRSSSSAELNDVLDAMVLDGRLRIASDDELAALRKREVA